MSTARRRPHTSRGGRASSRSVAFGVGVGVGVGVGSFGVSSVVGGVADGAIARAGDEGGAIWWREGRLREAEARAVWRPRRARGRTRRLVRTGSARTRNSEEDSARARVVGRGKDRTITSDPVEQVQGVEVVEAWTRTRATIGGERLGWILLMIVLFIGRGLMSDNPLKVPSPSRGRPVLRRTVSERRAEPRVGGSR